MIPKIIHQTWKSRELPARYARLCETFKARLPGWEYRFWDDNDCLELVRDKFPQYLDAYQALPLPVQRADYFRYMALCEFGGLYADVDCECKRRLDFLRGDDDFIVATELKTNSAKVMKYYQTDLQEVFCMWAFLSAPRHPILLDLLERIKSNAWKKFSDNPVLDTIKRTGPHAFTASVVKYLNEGGKITVVPGSYFGCCNTTNPLTLGFTYAFPELFRRVYIRHHFDTSWLDKETKKKMVKENLRLK